MARKELRKTHPQDSTNGQGQGQRPPLPSSSVMYGAHREPAEPKVAGTGASRLGCYAVPLDLTRIAFRPASRISLPQQHASRPVSAIPRRRKLDNQHVIASSQMFPYAISQDSGSAG